MNHAGFFLPCGAAWERRLPDRLTPLDEKTLFSRAWTLLVCSRRGAETLSRLPRAPLCRTVLLPAGSGCTFPSARQTVDCGLHSRSSLHTAHLHIDINSAVSIVGIAAHTHVSTLSSVCKGTQAMRRAARW